MALVRKVKVIWGATDWALRSHNLRRKRRLLHLIHLRSTATLTTPPAMGSNGSTLVWMVWLSPAVGSLTLIGLMRNPSISWWSSHGSLRSVLYQLWCSGCYTKTLQVGPTICRSTLTIGRLTVSTRTRTTC